jgi:hypothetical protein
METGANGVTWTTAASPAAAEPEPGAGIVTIPYPPAEGRIVKETRRNSSIAIKITVQVSMLKF